jgi:DNA-binding transcriptional regulator YhcF (GntR family)
MKGAEQKKMILDLIPRDKRNAIHLRELESETNINVYRVKKIIQELRQEKNIILSGRCGYWISDNVSEIMEFLNAFDAQTMKRHRTTRAMHTWLKERNQEGLDL